MARNPARGQHRERFAVKGVQPKIAANGKAQPPRERELAEIADHHGVRALFHRAAQQAFDLGLLAIGKDARQDSGQAGLGRDRERRVDRRKSQLCKRPRLLPRPNGSGKARERLLLLHG